MIAEEKKAKRNAYLAVWREKNRDKTRAAQQRYYEANRESCNAKALSCRKENREYYSQQAMKWASENKERHLEIKRSFYARNAASEIARVRRRQGKIRHGNMLMNQAEQAEVQGMYDFCRIFKDFEVDHIIPLNGKVVLGNLQVLPVSENRSKGNRFAT